MNHFENVSCFLSLRVDFWKSSTTDVLDQGVPNPPITLKSRRSVCQTTNPGNNFLNSHNLNNRFESEWVTLINSCVKNDSFEDNILKRNFGT